MPLINDFSALKASVIGAIKAFVLITKFRNQEKQFTRYDLFMTYWLEAVYIEVFSPMKIVSGLNQGKRTGKIILKLNFFRLDF